MSTAAAVRTALRKHAKPAKAALLQRFFKTGKGQYGYGDVFIGVMVPEQRAIVKRFYKTIPLSEVSELVKSNIHEERLTGLITLVEKYKRATPSEQKAIYTFYLKHLRWVNNWDLVDVTCRDVIGAYLFDKPRTLLYTLAVSKNLWERRIAIIATFYFIGKKDFADSLAIAKILLHDEHDLIHKAVGWMLREIGKRSRETEEAFLKKYAAKMPRTMLRYAIEKFPPAVRSHYLSLT